MTVSLFPEERDAVELAISQPRIVRAGTEDAIVQGRVARGDQRGRELGFPTANIVLSREDSDLDGVWAAEVMVGAERRRAVVSVGQRPTYYEDGVRLLEAHLLDYSGDLYGSIITVHLRHLLRTQRRFGSTVALVRQMRRDTEEARRLLQPGRRSGVRALTGVDADVREGRRMIQRQRRIAAAVQHGLERERLDHATVAAESDVPVAYLRWLYPDIADLRDIAGTVRINHAQ